jgi:nucleoside-diphosphate-sugar epimerase
MAQCLVTGGAGFIGSTICRALLVRGYSVRVLDNFSTGRHENLEDIKEDIDVQVGDLRDDDALFNALLGVRYIFHVGALPSVARSVMDPLMTHEVNVNGTLKLLLAAREAGVERVVFSSSSSVYGNTPVLPKQEDMMPYPLSPYALSKLTGEHYLRIFYQLYGIRTFALRYFNVFGPRQDPASQYAAVIPLFVNAYRNDQAPVIHGDGEQTRDFTFVDDVVAGNLCCLTAPDAAAGGVFNLAWGHRISINSLAAKIGALMGKSLEPEHVAPRAADVRDSQADSTRARELLGWQPQVTFDEGLARTVEWFMSGERCGS